MEIAKEENYKSPYENKKETFENQYKRIQECTNTKTQVQLAGYLGIRQSSISDAKSRLAIPDNWLITMLANSQINPMYILKGTLPIKINTGDNLSTLPELIKNITKKVNIGECGGKEFLEQLYYGIKHTIECKSSVLTFNQYIGYAFYLGLKSQLSIKGEI